MDSNLGPLRDQGWGALEPWCCIGSDNYVALRIRVANLQFGLALRLRSATLPVVMPAIEDVDFKDPHSIIRLLAKRRYGPNGNIAQVGRRVTLIEAGYVTARGWWGVPKALAEANTNFHRVEVSIRLELIVCDLLQRPEMAATRKWSASFGYSSPATISRALMDPLRGWTG
jgi:hypothetical protein